MLCKYQNILGKVNTGVHSVRLFNVAIIDVLMTIISAFIIYLYIPKYNFFVILASLFILGIGLHRLFCVRTTVDKILFLNAIVYDSYNK
uniref:Uncharacterized protein n=1 Tax=viral metagenome TaxID=1070528 RepID=A0A6C0C1C0_9ZZZZ